MKTTLRHASKSDILVNLHIILSHVRKWETSLRDFFGEKTTSTDIELELLTYNIICNLIHTFYIRIYVYRIKTHY